MILKGVRVVELATFVFGPAAGTVMADFGADVVKIEHPVTGDPYRYLYRLKPLPECEENYCWILDARGKRSVALDCKREEGRAVAADLVMGADVLITNLHPSVLAALHMRWEDLASRAPRLIYAHATGYGEAGAEVEKPGYDATAWWARSGMMDSVRPSGGEPALATPAMGDHPSAMTLLAGILLALRHRDQTGRGTKVSTSLMANGVWANSVYIQAALCGAPAFRPISHATTSNALVSPYETADGRHFYLAMIQEDGEWGRFLEAIERRDLGDDPRFATLPERRRNAAALVAILDELFRTAPLAAWRERLDRHKVTFGVIARAEEAPDDAQMRANHLFREIEGGGGRRTVDSPIWIAGVEKAPPRRAPEIGEHGREVLRELGYPDSRIEELVGAGVIRAPGPPK
jgi:crotonobetainyl-CoA:carnitine CoA-transferase CaiB-like acyl-CoA transferase